MAVEEWLKMRGLWPSTPQKLQLWRVTITRGVIPITWTR
jgi:hypothetical protein